MYCYLMFNVVNGEYEFCGFLEEFYDNVKICSDDVMVVVIIGIKLGVGEMICLEDLLVILGGFVVGCLIKCDIVELFEFEVGEYFCLGIYGFIMF